MIWKFTTRSVQHLGVLCITFDCFSIRQFLFCYIFLSILSTIQRWAYLNSRLRALYLPHVFKWTHFWWPFVYLCTYFVFSLFSFKIAQLRYNHVFTDWNSFTVFLYSRIQMCSSLIDLCLLVFDLSLFFIVKLPALPALIFPE